MSTNQISTPVVTSSTSSDPRKIVIFDTTLRDGEQSPGASMNLGEKLTVAHKLADLGVDVIEAGFPIASPGDFESVKCIADEVRGSSICGLARCKEVDINACRDALAGAENPRIHVFLATSPIHRQFKLRMNMDEIIELAVWGVKLARNYCPNVEFSPEDGSRTELDYLCRVTEAVIDAGATTVNIPDTVGYAMPSYMKHIFQTLVEKVPNIDKCVLSCHNHDDLGLAVANSLASVEGGAGQIECTINGLGERAGNTALEEVVMALRTRRDVFNADTNIHTELLVPASRLVSQVTGLPVPRNKAVVGRNAFAHESGVHQDGVLKNRQTYEIMDPKSVGFEESELVLGKHSGKAALEDRARKLGYVLNSDQLKALYDEFIALTDKKKVIYDEDIQLLISHGRTRLVPTWTLDNLMYNCGKGLTPVVRLGLKKNGNAVSAVVSDGDGPVDAAFIALKQIVEYDIQCVEFNVRSVSVGHDAQGNVTVQVMYNNQMYRGQGVSTDTVEASVLAFLDAINRIVALETSKSICPAQDSEQVGKPQL